MPLKFEWNPNKAKKNIEKHRVSFDGLDHRFGQFSSFPEKDGILL